MLGIDTPDTYFVKFHVRITAPSTTHPFGIADSFVVKVHKAWAPQGAIHFHTLAKNSYYSGNRFFHVTKSMAQFGINGVPKTFHKWYASIFDTEQSHHPPAHVLVYAGHTSASWMTLW
jgi:hypothetical protein